MIIITNIIIIITITIISITNINATITHINIAITERLQISFTVFNISINQSYLCSGIGPDNSARDPVNSQPAGPANVILDDDISVLSVHFGSLYSWLLAPVRPEHITGGEQIISGLKYIPAMMLISYKY